MYIPWGKGSPTNQRLDGVTPYGMWTSQKRGNYHSDIQHNLDVHDNDSEWLIIIQFHFYSFNMPTVFKKSIRYKYSPTQESHILSVV